VEQIVTPGVQSSIKPLAQTMGYRTQPAPPDTRQGPTGARSETRPGASTSVSSLGGPVPDSGLVRGMDFFGERFEHRVVRMNRQIEAIIPKGSFLAVMAPTPVCLLDDPSVPLMPQDFEMVQTLVLDSSIIVNAHGGLVPARPQDARAAERFRAELAAPTEPDGMAYSSAPSQPGSTAGPASVPHTVNYAETPPQKRVRLDLMSPAHFSTPRRETYKVTPGVPGQFMEGDPSDSETEMEDWYETEMEDEDWELADVQTAMTE
jgi:hypothetical protein